MHIRSLSMQECSSLLSDSRLARLACAQDGKPYVVPIFVAYADNALYGFSMPGRKIDFMRANPQVCLVVEERGQGHGWKSVVVDGRFEELPDRIGHKKDRDRAWSLLSRHSDWWEPGAIKPALPPRSDPAQHIFFRILIEQMSGREAKEQ